MTLVYVVNCNPTVITIDVTGSELHDVVWGSIRRLHEIGLNVICVVADGAKPNRRFMKDHSHKEGMKNGIVYKARNIYNPPMFVYFMSDVPHLMKTTRNCWLCSQFGGTRCLWVTILHNHYSHIITHRCVRIHVHVHTLTENTKSSCKVCYFQTDKWRAHSLGTPSSAV